ncbi:MAG TPA: FAD-binding protein [Sphingomicrobium sp.]|nr:FAD-binding protein [Sphingomicrobium sp.]
MASNSNISTFSDVEWKNFHGNIKRTVKKHILVKNGNPGSSTLKGMRETAAALQSVISDAKKAGVQLRTQGARWSFSDITAPDKDGWILETDQLGYRFFLKQVDIEPQSGLVAEELFLAQAGAKISRINEALETRSRRSALRTSGASNGQTIAGALATGVHGSAIDVGAMESQVAGLQLLTADKNIWLESARAPVVSTDFAKKLDSILIRDDLLFDAALVNLGALGVIHAVLLKTTGRYRLNSSLKHLSFDQLRRTMTTLDFRGSGSPDETRRPYFFQGIIDPNVPNKVYATFRYKEPCPPDFEPSYDRESGYVTGTDIPALIGRAIDFFPALRDLAVSLIAQRELKEIQQLPHEFQTPGQAYSFTTSRSGVASSAFAVPLAQTATALAIMQEAFRDHPGAPAVHACRFAQKSPAILGFTRYDPTCIIDLDGIESQTTRDLIELTADRLEAAGMPFTMHWGKTNFLTKERVRHAYGDGAIERWKLARMRLLPDQAERAVFSSPMTSRCGLT